VHDSCVLNHLNADRGHYETAEEGQKDILALLAKWIPNTSDTDCRQCAKADVRAPYLQLQLMQVLKRGCCTLKLALAAAMQALSESLSTQKVLVGNSQQQQKQQKRAKHVIFGFKEKSSCNMSPPRRSGLII
jgi:hypothetical protein